MKEFLDKLLSMFGVKNVDEADPLFDVQAKYPPIPVPTACFYATVIRVIDGDTLEIELNKHHYLKQRMIIRLLGVDARETRGDERELGLSDKQYAEAWVEEAKERAARKDLFVVQTVATDKYGRWLAWIWRTCDNANLNFDLLITGHGDPAPPDARLFLLRDVTQTMKGVEVE